MPAVAGVVLQDHLLMTFRQKLAANTTVMTTVHYHADSRGRLPRRLQLGPYPATLAEGVGPRRHHIAHAIPKPDIRFAAGGTHNGPADPSDRSLADGPSNGP